MRNDVLQNYLDQFLKCLADNFDNLKFQDTSKVVIFRPPNSYILHCHSKADNFDNLKLQDASKVAIFRPPNSYILHCHDKRGLFTIYLKGNDMKNSKFGKS